MMKIESEPDIQKSEEPGNSGGGSNSINYRKSTEMPKQLSPPGYLKKESLENRTEIMDSKVGDCQLGFERTMYSSETQLTPGCQTGINKNCSERGSTAEGLPLVNRRGCQESDGGWSAAEPPDWLMEESVLQIHPE
jgi:hypothetical protein